MKWFWAKGAISGDGLRIAQDRDGLRVSVLKDGVELGWFIAPRVDFGAGEILLLTDMAVQIPLRDEGVR